MVPGSADDRIGDGGTFPPIPFGRMDQEQSAPHPMHRPPYKERENRDATDLASSDTKHTSCQAPQRAFRHLWSNNVRYPVQFAGQIWATRVFSRLWRLVNNYINASGTSNSSRQASV